MLSMIVGWKEVLLSSQAVYVIEPLHLAYLKTSDPFVPLRDSKDRPKSHLNAKQCLSGLVELCRQVV